LQHTPASEVVVCSVVKAELEYGIRRGSYSAQRVAAQQAFLSQFVSLPFDDAAAQRYGQIRAQLEMIGRPIGPNDLLIAAIALANRVTLVTHNTGEFSRITGLQVEDGSATEYRGVRRTPLPSTLFCGATLRIGRPDNSSKWVSQGSKYGRLAWCKPSVFATVFATLNSKLLADSTGDRRMGWPHQSMADVGKEVAQVRQQVFERIRSLLPQRPASTLMFGFV
jgi:tRNA(fMet)-specific endonuclease VapC